LCSFAQVWPVSGLASDGGGDDDEDDDVGNADTAEADARDDASIPYGEGFYRLCSHSMS
jgi:hypothetical protein